MICTAKMNAALKGMGFTERIHPDSLELQIKRDDGKHLCTIIVYRFYADSTRTKPDHWEMNIVYWAVEDLRHPTDHVVRVTDPADVMKAVIFWAMQKGRHDMKREVKQAIGEHIRAVNQLTDEATTASLMRDGEHQEAMEQRNHGG